MTGPLVILAIDETSGRCAPVLEARQHRPFGLFRGSAGPLPLPDTQGGGRLVIVHSVSVHERRVYLHRFLRLDDDWRITEVSRPFYFRHLGTEFVCGACLAHGGDDLLMTLGVEDREAWVCRVPLAVVRDSLRPLPAVSVNASVTPLRVG